MRQGNRWATDVDLQRVAMSAVEANDAVRLAEEERRRVVRAALASGHSTRSLASFLGVGHNTVARWARDAR